MFILVAALAVIAALAACGASSTPAPQPPGAAPTSLPPTSPPTSRPATSTPAPTRQLPTNTPLPTATPTPTPQPTPTHTAAPEPTPQPQGPALPATIVGADGFEVVVEDISRIVSLNGDITEVIFALGLGDNLAAVDTSATYPAEALALPKIGYQRGLSAEGILSMEPSVVIGNTLAGPPEVIEQIRATGTAVVILDPAVTLAGAAAKIRNVAQALGVSDVGEEIASGLEAEIEAVKALAAEAEDKPTAVFLYLRGLDSLFLAGQYDLSHELFEASGAIGGGGVLGVRERFIPLTAESLAAADPDCIVVFTSGLQSVGGQEGLLQIPGVAQTNAAEEGCILDFDGQYIAGGGPRTGMALQELLAAFHPDLAPTP